MDKRIISTLTVLIMAVWLVSFLVDIVDKTYDPPASVHALMLAVAGAAYGATLRRNNKEPGDAPQ